MEAPDLDSIDSNFENEQNTERELSESIERLKCVSPDSDLYSEDYQSTIGTEETEELVSPNGRSLSLCSDDVDSVVSDVAGGIGSLELDNINADSVFEFEVHNVDDELAINDDDDDDDKTEKCESAHDNADTDSEKLNRRELSPDTEAVLKDLLNLSPDAQNAPSELFEDREFDFLRTGEPLRRSISLKTNKTPPGTPSRKKAVRFADALGLDLESVRHVFNQDTPPRIPNSATADLKIGLLQERGTTGNKYLSPLFPQPGADSNFHRRVLEQKVVLENAMINGMTITGTVRVANVAFHKRVLVRYTCNGWITFTDIYGSYVQDSFDGQTDRFSFTIIIPSDFNIGSRLELSVNYNAEGQEYWDNNYGSNYAIVCYAGAIPTIESDNTWMHFLWAFSDNQKRCSCMILNILDLLKTNCPIAPPRCSDQTQATLWSRSRPCQTQRLEGSCSKAGKYAVCCSYSSNAVSYCWTINIQGLSLEIDSGSCPIRPCLNTTTSISWLEKWLPPSITL